MPVPVLAVLAVLATLAVWASACGTSGFPTAPDDGTDRVDIAPLVRLSPAAGSAVDPAGPLTVSVLRGRLTDVTVAGPDGRMVAGRLSRDERSWRSVTALASATRYAVRIAADDGDGGRGETTAALVTRPGTKRLTAVLGPVPYQGGTATYGVGQPITARLSHPVRGTAGRQAVERALKVASQPAVVGAWHWVDDRNLHFRPREYWPAHATVQVSFAAWGRRIEGTLYGGAPSRIAFRTADRVEALVDAAAHRLTFSRNGTVVRIMPVTTGKPGFETRNGIKVVLGKEEWVRMDGSTIGIPASSSDSYVLDVQWAVRTTWSGEYVHAAPWSVAAQGWANVSHGCTGMSTWNGRWFFGGVREGDIVRVVGSQGRAMEPFGNGFGDWNLPWSAWLAGSAAGETGTAGGIAGPRAAPQAALSPQL